MALTNDQFTASDLAAVISEVWTPIILEEYFPKTVFANFFRDASPYLSDGGDIAHIPDVFTNEFTPKTQSTQGAEVDTESPAMQDVTLTVDTHKYISILIGDKDLQQIARGIYDINAIYAYKMAGSLRDELESALAALVNSLGTYSHGDSSDELVDVELRQGIADLMGENLPYGELSFIMHPDVIWNQVMAIQKFYDAQQAGWSSNAPIVTGNFGTMDRAQGLRGMLYGIPVFESSNVASGSGSYHNVLAHRDAFAFATQSRGGSQVRFQTENKPDHLAMHTIADTLYGVVETRDTAGVLLDAGTSSVVS